MRQRLLYFPHSLENGKGPAPAVDLPEKPSRVWTLFRHTDENEPPELPIVPSHFHNAFLEDYVHDWKWRNGKFRYFSRVTEGPVWLLLEYAE